MFSAQDMKRCYLQKKFCVTTQDFKALVAIIWYCGNNMYEKNSLTSIFR